MQVSNDIDRRSMTWRTSISFAVLATLVVLLIGYLTSAGLLPIRQTIGLEGGELQFMSEWMKAAIAIGIILPAVTFAVGFKQPKLRKILGFYFLLLGVQILTEQIVSQTWMPSLVVSVGTLYTLFRVWQLRQGLQLMQINSRQSARYSLLKSAIWLMFCFWVSNLAVLLVLAWPSVL